MARLRFGMTMLASALVLAAGAASAQVPPDIATQLRAIGRIINPVAVGQIYAPLQPKAPWPDITVARDIAYGLDPLQKLDVFTPADKSVTPRAVVIFVHGGGFVRGDKAAPGSPFNDNMMVWAARHGLVGVNIDYRLAPKDPWPAGAQDVGAAVRWVRANAAQYGADPDRVFLWGHSAGANHVADYVAHTEFHGPGGSGLAGAILMSGVYGPMPAPNAYYGDEPAKIAQRASKPGLLKTKVPLMVITAELDPDMMDAAAGDLDKALCAADRCPVFLFAKDHDHMSEGLAVGTDDISVSGPVLVFIKTPR